MKNVSLRLLLLTILSFLAVSCSLFSPVSIDESSYLVKTAPYNVPTHRHHGGTLLVMQPSTLAIYDTTDMAYTTKPFQISYYVKNRWAENPENMLQPLLVKTLQRTHYFKAVVAAPFAGHYDYLLATNITEFLQDYTGCMPVFKFTLRAQLTNANTGQLMRSKEFSRVVPMHKKDPYAGVIAANEAVADVLVELANWIEK